MLINQSKKKKKIVFFIFIFICAILFGFYSTEIKLKKNDNLYIERTVIDALNNSIEQRIDDLLNQMSLDEKCAQLYGIGIMDTANNDRLGIPGFKMGDGPHGVRGFGQATSFPVGIAMTATWDPSLIERVGWAMGREFLAKGRNQALGPCVDITRDPRNGRSAESSGEEPYLGGKIGASLVSGIQSTQVTATVKHYTAVNHQTNRQTSNHVIDYRTLIELYGLPFRRSIQQGGARSVMNAFNWINGVPASENYHLLTEILRDKFNYEFYVVSDWWSIYNGAANSINAGVDIDMPGDVYPNELKTAVQNGIVPIENLDLAVRRVLRTKIVSGLLDNFPQGNPADIDSIEHRNFNLEAAQKSIVLLKNEDNILPLNRDSINSIALIGPSADVCQLDGFGSSEVSPTYTVTPRQGIQNKATNIIINYAKGCDINSYDTSGFQEAKNVAAMSDIVVFVGGLDRTQEGEGYDIGGDRKSGSVQLPGMQQDLINELASVNSNIIVVLESGGICAVQSCIDNIKGFIYAFYPGQEGGNAIADVLFGNINPGGKLPVTMPKDDSQLPLWEDLDFTGDLIDGFGYRRFDSFGLEPQYAFGHGLSYTDFIFNNLQYTSSALGDGQIEINIDVTNTGQKAGDEVVQLYLTPLDTSVPMPIKQLRGFERVSLEPGETKTITLTLGPEELSYWSEAYDCFYVEEGTFNFQIGNSSDNLPIFGSFEITSNYEYRFNIEDPSDTTPPATPTGLTATVTSSSQITLNWNDNTESDLANYRVYRSASASGTYSFIGQTTSSFYSNTGLSSSTTYYYGVSAVDTSSNESPQTNYVSATTLEGGGATTLRAQYTCGNTNSPTQDIRAQIQVLNDGPLDVALTDVTVRYWFTSEPPLSDLNYSCDYAAVGSSGITSTFGALGESDYLEIGFTSSVTVPTWLGGDGSSNSLPVGANTGDIQNRIGRNSNIDFDQSNDYSFDATITAYTDNPQITVYYQGNLVWGNEPGIINPTPTINHPQDITYQEGETGNEIIWIATDNDPATYTITQDVVQVETGTWTSGNAIIINVDGLLLGEASEYTISVSDQAGQTATDTVFVSTISISLPDLGDVNRDGLVDIVDALMIAQYYVGLDPDGFWEPSADVNNDGFIDIIDALMVAQAYVGLIELPP